MSQKTIFQNNFDVRDAESTAFGKLTWSGLMIAAFGWMLLLSGGSVQIMLSSTAPSVGLIARCAIVSGFALALLGAVQTGFVLLQRRLEAALQRASRSEPSSVSVYEPQVSREVSLVTSGRTAPARAALARLEPVIVAPRRLAPARATPVEAPPVKPPPRKVLERGWWKDRAYTIFHDGSVEIETLLGLRRFACMDDAQHFIG